MVNLPCFECHNRYGHKATCSEYHRPRLIGTIELREGAYGIAVGSTLFYPLEGASGIAEDFRETFGDAGAHDLGKQVFNHRGVICMENAQQMTERLAK